ncbi:MAG: glycosyltransferase family 2 protein [Hyphomicrobium sp.]|nr:glycosyltransferase family 2 protein [Hyphomicrobium sp.]MBN9267843.1 glycosyltransferase family 2 protein [Hyphomicrobium sp.]
MGKMIAYSAVIPAFNTQAYIADAILSIRAQTVPPQEIIVVDDGSTDRTVEVVRSLGADIRIIRQENRGAGPATTAAVEAVTTGLIAGLDSDDIWLPHKMERQLQAVQGMPEIAGCFARMRQFQHGADMDADGPVADSWLRSSMVMRIEVALGAGPIVGRIGELVDWLARIREQGHRLHLLPEVLALRRARPGSLTYDRDAACSSAYLLAARKAILRRRETPAR